MVKYLTVLLLLFSLSACANSDDVFGDIGANVSAPSAMSIDAATNRLYLINSNDEVLYDSKQGSFQVLDISAPTAPVLLGTAQTKSFSGEIYVDTVTSIAYTPNRYTANDQATTGLLYAINTNEASASFLAASESTLVAGAYGIACCYPANRAWIATTFEGEELQYMDLGGALAVNSLSLDTTLSNGNPLSPAGVNRVVIIGTQAFLSRVNGGIIVVSLDKVGVAGAYPVDYFISNIEAPAGLATDGVDLYVVGQGYVGDTWTNYVLRLDVSSLDPLVTHTTTQVVDKDAGGLVKAVITVGQNPQEIALSTTYAFVTNEGEGTVSVIDLATNANAQTVAVGVEPFSVDVLPNGDGTPRYVYVGNVVDNTISIIDGATFAVVATYP